MATKQSNLVGGSFLLKDAQLDDIFIPEQFSEEQNGIKDMVIDFCKQEIHSMGFEKLSVLSADKDLDKVKEIFDKASELGFCAGSIPETYGGMGLDFNTGLVFSEAIALGFS
ncbi:MAG: acyl-CoA dehydrogenase family protein, partial [Bacteroidetes bacterium]|nr:acyl-CoA dehydrogenase family protein [Bacteroidota bacterium]